MSEELRDWVQAELPEQLQFLKRVVEINSHSHNAEGVNAVQQEFQVALSALGLHTERIPCKGLGDHLFARSTSPAPHYLLVGHADTVHAAESSFNSLRLDDSFAYGPGSMDMKGGLVSMLWALKAVATFGDLQSTPVSVFILSDEEIGSTSSLASIQAIAEKCAGALVFEAERAGREILTERKGVKFYEVTCYGQEAHAGNNHQRGVNAITLAARVVERLQSLTTYETGRTLNVGKIQGGTAVNVVPAEARLTFEIRSNKLDDFHFVEALLAELAEKPPLEGARLSTKEMIEIPPMRETKQSAALFESYLSACKKVGVETRKTAKPASGGSTANYIAALGVPTIDGIGPYGEDDHSPKERLEISSLSSRTLAAAQFLLDLQH